MKRAATALAVIGLATAAAPAANAASISFDGSGTLVVTAAAGDTDRILFYPSAFGDGRISVSAQNGAPTSSSGACEVTDYGVTYCDWNPAAGVRADLGDGHDRGSVSGDFPASVRFTLSGGTGNDELAAAYDAGPTTLDGGPGDDVVHGGPSGDNLAGGDGNDTVEGRDGGDAVSGGGGDDLLSGDGSKGKWADSIDGGPGTDRIDFDWSDGAYDAPDERVDVTLAGASDDGRPGEGDDVRNVEKIVTSSFGRLVGTDAAEHLEVFQITGSGELIGHGGDDTLKGADGPDTLNGGAGADDLDAGFGDDHITGGPGADSIAGDRRGGDCGPVWCKLPFGNDTIDARDGERDSVTCGVGADSVKADPIDVVAGDCETVDRAAAGPGVPEGKRKAGRACVVPKVRGLKVKAAKRRLAKAGCKAKVRYAKSRKVRRGRVVKAGARPGKRLGKGTKVTLTVSRG
jgi:Ca2+-binding RTX toxin-like protein